LIQLDSSLFYVYGNHLQQVTLTEEMGLCKVSCVSFFKQYVKIILQLSAKDLMKAEMNLKEQRLQTLRSVFSATN